MQVYEIYNLTMDCYSICCDKIELYKKNEK